MASQTDWTTRIALFEGLEEADRRRIERESRWHRYGAGAQILDKGSQSTDVYFVLEGAVDVINYSASGRMIAFAKISAGGFFGELAAIDGASRTASVQAEKETEVAILPSAAFAEVLHRHSNVAVRMIQRLVQIVRSCDERIMDLSTLGAIQRVYAELLRMAVPDSATGEQWVIWPYPPEREIASRVSTSRETVARAVGVLRNAGIVRRKGRSLYILDRARLEQIRESYEGVP